MSEFQIERPSYIINGMTKDEFDFVETFYHLYDNYPPSMNSYTVWYQISDFKKHSKKFAIILHTNFPKIKIYAIDDEYTDKMAWLYCYQLNAHLYFEISNDCGRIIFDKPSLINQGFIL